jgi:hypothetical protein
MKSLIRAAIVAVALTVAVARVFAHHNAAHTYDVDQPVALSGTVTAVQWKNPHVLVYLDATSDDGTVVNWKVEMIGPLGGMIKLGLNKDSLKVGEAIGMTACVAKDGSHTAAAHAVTVPSVFDNKHVGLC